MKLLLIRHGEPDPERDPVDPPLTDHGRRLAGAMADWLGEEGITAIYSSPTRRALGTAAPLAARTGAPIVEQAGLAEFGGGHEYVRIDDLRRTGDARWTAMAAGDLSVYGTDATTFRAEVSRTINGIIDAHPGETVAVVSHAGVINAYLGGLLGIDRLLWVELDYAAVCRLAASRDGVRTVLSLNERAHGCNLPAGYRPVPDPLISTRSPGGTP